MNIHNNKRSYVYKSLITKKHIWFIKDEQKRYPIPLSRIVLVLKSKKNPEMVLVTGNSVDNIRISASSEER